MAVARRGWHRFTLAFNVRLCADQFLVELDPRRRDGIFCLDFGHEATKIAGFPQITQIDTDFIPLVSVNQYGL